MIFPYLPLPTKRPVPSLGGAMVRYRPIVPIRVIGPSGSRLLDGCVDCGSDDTIFPLSLARKLSVNLNGAPQGEAHPVGGMVVPYSYAVVSLRLSDGIETCEWRAMVGFVDLPLRWALLGHAGVLDFFDCELRGARREVSFDRIHHSPAPAQSNCRHLHNVRQGKQQFAATAWAGGILRFIKT